MKIEISYLTTLSQIKNGVKEIKTKIAEELNLERSQFRLQNGLIVLHGYHEELKTWFSLSNTITEFNEYSKRDEYSKYKLYCHVEFKQK